MCPTKGASAWFSDESARRSAARCTPPQSKVSLKVGFARSCGQPRAAESTPHPRNRCVPIALWGLVVPNKFLVFTFHGRTECQCHRDPVKPTTVPAGHCEPCHFPSTSRGTRGHKNLQQHQIGDPNNSPSPTGPSRRTGGYTSFIFETWQVRSHFRFKVDNDMLFAWRNQTSTSPPGAASPAFDPRVLLSPEPRAS